jgi:hypothetical protein
VGQKLDQLMINISPVDDREVRSIMRNDSSQCDVLKEKAWIDILKRRFQSLKNIRVKE